MYKYKVSIIVPIFKSERVLKRCIDSIILQTHKNIEIILINDGSPDSSQTICNYYSDKDSRVKVIQQKNMGVSNARNNGILTSTGKYIVFVDSDDFIESTMIEKMLNFLEKHGLELCTCGYKLVLQNKEGIMEFKNSNYGNFIIKGKKNLYDYFYPFMDKDSFHKIWSKMYKAQIIKENKLFFNEKLASGEDFLFNLEYVQHISKCGFIEDELYNYYIGINYLSNKYEKDAFNKRCYIIEYLKSFFDENNLNFNVIHFQYIKSVYAQIMMFYHKDCDMSCNKIKDVVENLINRKEVLNSLSEIKSNGIMQKILVAILKTKNISFILVCSKFMNYIYMKKRMRA